MKKIWALAVVLLPLAAVAQNTLTPEEQLRQAERQLTEARRQLEIAEQNLARAREAVSESVSAGTVKEGEAVRPSSWAVPAGGEGNSAATPKGRPSLPKADDVYLRPDCIPLVDGKVVWSERVEVPGVPAERLYDKALAFLTRLTKEENQLAESKVALVNPGEHSLIATIHEKLVFSSTFLSLDFSKFNYVLQVSCTDGAAVLTMSRLTYNYDVQGKVSNYTAEEWITDKASVNKKRTRLLPVSGKFRRATVDRKDYIFKVFKDSLK